MPDKPFVRDYMTSNPTTLSPHEPLLKAVLTIRSLNIRHLPVDVGGKLVGIITDRDVARVSPSIVSQTSQEEYNKVFEQTMVERVMVKNPTAVTPDTPLSEAVGLLHDNKWGCLPVTENEKLVGIITLTDGLRYALTTLGGGGGSITL